MYDWTPLMHFVRGPMFYAALVFFIAGMLYRLVHVLMLGFGKNLVEPKSNPAEGALRSFLNGWLILPFAPRIRDAWARNPITYVAGGSFHVALFVVIFLGAAHMLVWKSLLGFGWPTLPLPIVDALAAIGLLAMVVLFFNRLMSPVLKLLSKFSDFMNLIMVFLPFLTGYFLTHRLFLRYEAMFTLHVLSINLLLIWIPLSRISHFMFYFITKARHGARFATHGSRP